jgi:hypothetical protein
MALLESLGKALERIIIDRLSSIAEEYHLLLKFQMGGRPKRDTITTLDLLTEQVHTIWNSGSQWVATMLCFDITGHMLGALLWGKWGLFEPQGIQALKSSAVWCNGVARGAP